MTETERLKEELNELEAFELYLCSDNDLDDYMKMQIVLCDDRKRFIQNRLRKLQCLT